MFDFEKLTVYEKAKSFYIDVNKSICTSPDIDTTILNQLKRASLSITLNIAEGASRYSKADKRNFYITARGSLFECIAIFDILKDDAILENEKYTEFYTSGEELSKMLYSMIQKIERQN